MLLAPKVCQYRVANMHQTVRDSAAADSVTEEEAEDHWARNKLERAVTVSI